MTGNPLKRKKTASRGRKIKRPSPAKDRKRAMKVLKNKLDALFSKILRKRGFCEWCQKTENLQCSHIHSRTKMVCRWDLKNAFCLCAGCHLYRWHQHPILAAEFARERLGDYEYTALLHRANTIKQWKLEELQELFEMLTREYERTV